MPWGELSHHILIPAPRPYLDTGPILGSMSAAVLEAVSASVQERHFEQVAKIMDTCELEVRAGAAGTHFMSGHADAVRVPPCCSPRTRVCLRIGPWRCTCSATSTTRTCECVRCMRACLGSEGGVAAQVRRAAAVEADTPRCQAGETLLLVMAPACMRPDHARACLSHEMLCMHLTVESLPTGASPWVGEAHLPLCR